MYLFTTSTCPNCRMAKKMLEEKKMRFTTELPARVEMTVRENDEKQFVFLFNNDKKEKRFVLEGTTIELQPFEMKIQEKINKKERYTGFFLTKISKNPCVTAFFVLFLKLTSNEKGNEKEKK